jgi:hypothetical protein
MLVFQVGRAARLVGVVSGHRLSWLGIAVSLPLIVLAWIGNLDEFVGNRNPYYALATGFATDPADAFVGDFHRRAVANCPPEDVVLCPKTQQLFASNLFFNYPIYSLFGRAIDPAASARFATLADHAVLAAAITAFCAGVALFLVATAGLGAAGRGILATCLRENQPRS